MSRLPDPPPGYLWVRDHLGPDGSWILMTHQAFRLLQFGMMLSDDDPGDDPPDLQAMSCGCEQCRAREIIETAKQKAASDWRDQQPISLTEVLNRSAHRNDPREG